MLINKRDKSKEKETIVAANSLSKSSSSEKIKVLKPTGAEAQIKTILEIGPFKASNLTIPKPKRKPKTILKEMTVKVNLTLAILG
jgi:hypothetical protein